MTETRPTPETLDKFKEAAKQVETGDSDEAFERALKRVPKLLVEKCPAK